jgi:hypothetical protein
MLDTPLSTIYYWKDHGILPYVALGGKILFDLEDVLKCINNAKKEWSLAFDDQN